MLTAGPGERSLAVLVRTEPARWTAHVLLGDEADALALAREIDASVATLVEGGAQAMVHVRAGLSRSVQEQVLRRLFVPEMPDDWLVPDERPDLARGSISTGSWRCTTATSCATDRGRDGR